MSEAVQELTEGRRAEYIIDASGAGQIFHDMPRVLRKQGTFLLYGHGHTGVDLSVLNNLQFLEPLLVSPVGASGGFEPDGRPTTYRRALGLLETGRVKVGSFITHRYTSLDEVPAAFAGRLDSARLRQRCRRAATRGDLIDPSDVPAGLKPRLHMTMRLITFTPKTAPTSAPRAGALLPGDQSVLNFSVAVDASADVPLVPGSISTTSGCRRSARFTMRWRRTPPAWKHCRAARCCRAPT